ncbi:helix-turn-helix domain-containing protein [Acinetobacter haemolyticus]|uniref:helix-turn-helix domain-containing protein n=1 Tax=Acinetobacter haemolyticus TaxID=29430 RepID=UPI001372A76F|nr:helix-turn-helix domain-containing protein [Acinetobacter haemolyticus]NAR60046.1 protein ninH [Acinetobacter haemolyticus]NAR94188.1 protein ninH [Acinetobacter haemolyticus]
MSNTTLVTLEQVRQVIESQNSNVHAQVMALLEKPLFEQTLIKTRGNQTKAAELLGLNRGTFRKRLKNHNLIKS